MRCHLSCGFSTDAQSRQGFHPQPSPADSFHRPVGPKAKAMPKPRRRKDDASEIQVRRKNWLNNGNPPGDPRNAPRCGAKTRSGKPCQAPGMANGRCRMHGGASTGPRTAEGLANSRRSRWKHGRYSAFAIQNRRSGKKWVNISRFFTGRLRHPPSRIRTMELMDALFSNSERSLIAARALFPRIPEGLLGASSRKVLAPGGKTEWKGKES